MHLDLNSLNPNAGPIGTKASDAQIDQWVEQFHRDGYLVLHDVIPHELIQPMKDDLDRRVKSSAATRRDA